jgi:spore germination protein GerM
MPRALLILLAVLLLAILTMGAFILRLTRQTEQDVPRAADLRPLAPVAAGPPQEVTLYLAQAEGTLQPRPVTVALPAEADQRAREVLRALLAEYTEPGAAHPLPPEADVNDVYLVEGGLAVVDVNAAFAAGHRSGILLESLTLASLVRTLAANVEGVTRVKFLVEGAERETLAGHADLSGFFHVEEVRAMVRDSQ